MSLHSHVQSRNYLTRTVTHGHISVTWLNHMWHDSLTCYVTHSLAPRQSHLTHTPHHAYVLVTWLIHMWHDSLIYVTWLTHMLHDSILHATSQLLHAHANSFVSRGDMTHSCVTWLLHMWHDSFPFPVATSQLLDAHADHLDGRERVIVLVASHRLDCLYHIHTCIHTTHTHKRKHIHARTHAHTPDIHRHTLEVSHGTHGT